MLTVVLVMGLLPLSISAAGAGDVGPVGFRTADRSAACVYIAPSKLIACRRRQGGPLLALGETGEPRSWPSASFNWDPSLPVLEPGATWERGGLRCKATADQLDCANSSGASIFVGREGAGAIATPLEGHPGP